MKTAQNAHSARSSALAVSTMAARVVWTGTQDGEYQGQPPTHNKLRFATADFFRIADGKIAEHWDVVNVLPRMIALGQIQLPEDATAKPR